jgi:hypothetical protein
MVVYDIFIVEEQQMAIQSWREEQVFQAIYVSEKFLDEFNMKMLKAKVRNKAAMFKMLLGGWIAGKYQLPKQIPDYVMAFAGRGGVGLSLYYPKSMDKELTDRMSQVKVTSKAVIFRSLLYGWAIDKIKADVKPKKRVIIPCRSVGVALPPASDIKFKKKAAGQGLSKSGAITKLLEKWATTGLGIEIGNSDIESYACYHCFGIMLPTKVDDLVEKKMASHKLTNKRIVIRKLVDMYINDRIKV